MHFNNIGWPNLSLLADSVPSPHSLALDKKDNTMTENTNLKEQIDYYKNRAEEYDEWFYREGRYFLGEQHKNQWFSEVKIVESALIDSKPHGNVLELACGTGIIGVKSALDSILNYPGTAASTLCHFLFHSQVQGRQPG